MVLASPSARRSRRGFSRSLVIFGVVLVIGPILLMKHVLWPRLVAHQALHERGIVTEARITQLRVAVSNVDDENGRMGKDVEFFADYSFPVPARDATFTGSGLVGGYRHRGAGLPLNVKPHELRAEQARDILRRHPVGGAISVVYLPENPEKNSPWKTIRTPMPKELAWLTASPWPLLVLLCIPGLWTIGRGLIFQAPKSGL